MLPEITQFEETVTLVSDTGIQFMDFALALDLRKEPPGEFVPLTHSLPIRLLYNEEKDFYFYEPEPEKIEKAKPVFSIDMKSSLELLDGLWLPIPFFRFMPPHRFDEGPSNWARMRLVKLPNPDIDGNSHRLTLAFDSRVMPKQDGTAYLAPNEEDVNSGWLSVLPAIPATHSGSWTETGFANGCWKSSTNAMLTGRAKKWTQKCARTITWLTTSMC